jgi:hypothetical protein
MYVSVSAGLCEFMGLLFIIFCSEFALLHKVKT